MVVGEGASLAHAGMMGVSDPPTDASLRAPMEDPPITASLGPIDRLIWRLKSLEECKHTPLPIGLCVNQIGKLREHLERFRKPLMNLSEMEETSFRAKWWMKEVRELCYDTEDYLVQSGATVHSRPLGRIARYIIWWIQSKLKLRTRLSKFMARAQVLKKTCETIVDLEIKAAISLNKEIKAEISLKEEKIADIETLTAQLVHMLAFEDDKQTELKLVAISGFQGSGKTTLARTLYVKCKRKFQCSAFVRVSRNPDFRSLLISILSQIKAPLPQGLSDVQGLISSISDHLQDKRYLIVIDDVRSPSVWDVISHAFPGGNFRSRMIVTTQSEQVEAAYSGYKLKSAIFKMGATADGCTHTSTKEKSKVLNIMYNNLPLHLKTCLLYFSMYPEGSTITKDDLAKRWVGEGFIAALERHGTEEISEVSLNKTEEIFEVSQAEREEISEGPRGERGEIVEVPQDKTEETTKVPQNKAEEIAHGYFDELVASGMIQPVGRNHKGDVLSCTVHHMVLDLIRYKSKEDNFIVVVDNLESTLGHPDIVRRLSVQFGCEKGASIPESVILTQVRSLAFYGFLKCVPSVADYGLLRVLNLHIWSDEDNTFDLTTIGELCHLVHLKIECNITVRLPWKIQRLQHLGTLELHAEVVAIPSDIGHLKKLMHLRCPRMADVRYLGDLTSLLDLQLTCFTVENLEEQMKCLRSILEKLSSLRCLALVHASGSCSVNTVPANPSRICISRDSLCIVSPALANLQRLELSRHCCIFSRVPKWIGELHELCILKIGVTELSKEDIDILKGMPALTALSLHVQPMSAERIVFGKEGFSMLKYFKFACTVPWLKFEAGAMPSLEKLKLCFNSPVVDEQGTTRIIIIEYLLGLKEIFAIIGSAGTDAGCSWRKAIRNDPGNPKVQLMGLIFYGDECRGVVTSEGSEEDETREADIRIHMQPESSGLPIPAHWREEEPEDQPCISEIISIGSESESTDEHTAQVTIHRIPTMENESMLKSRLDCNEEPKDLPSALLQQITNDFPEERKISHGASGVIGPLVSMLMNKLSSYLLDKYKVIDGMEEQHKILQRNLLAILGIITSAEEQAMAQREGAKAWLQELKTVAYKANDVFDEFKYEALRREAKKNGHYRKFGFDVIKLFPTHNPIVFRNKMGRKLCQILQDVEVLTAKMQAFGFMYQPQTPVYNGWRQTDHIFIDPQEIASRSRHKDKKNIVDMLLRQADNPDLAAVPIVGMGGLGKTTLAQLIYNDPQVQKHFQLLLWVSVSDCFDVKSLAKSIAEASPKKNHDTDKPPLDRLKKLVSGQRYLLVLDDVWNREVQKWEELKVCLRHGGTGSAVLTTTRDMQVAKIIGTDGVYRLNALEDSFIKEIIEARAFSSMKEKPAELVMMVDEIVKKCYGSPLAATTLGSVLRTKTSVDEWKAVSSSTSICTEETGILPILKLSYYNLPPYMKRCFAFCAVFPKDYKIDVDKLIQLWIANEFIPEHKEDSLETVGKYIFNELASRSFFLDIEVSKDNGEYFSRTTCKIHDLMHDVALSVMENECVVVTMEPRQTEWLPGAARHLYLSCDEAEGILNDSMKKRSPAIQTLLCDSIIESSLEHLSKYRSLHALKLCIGKKSFLLRPKYLHQLRYLDLSNSDVKELPKDISILYNLQMLDLSKCSNLDQLPRELSYMTSLRHLYTHGCLQLRSMPADFGKLTKLRTLTCFVAAVSGPDCSDVAELQYLNLGGQLELCQVENVTEAEAKVANLGNKKDLRELTLRWTYVCDSEVLNNFNPHDELQVLRIYSYGGKCMGILQNMVEIHLFHCERLQFLFRCGISFSFPKLQELTLDHLLNFERWSEINDRREGKVIFPVLEKLFIRHCRKLIALPKGLLLQQPCMRSPFPALKVLKLEDLENLERWDAVEETQGDQILFPQLEKLSIKKCPKLLYLPEPPKLSVLEIEDGKQEIFHWVDKYFSSVTNMVLKLEDTETTSEAECTPIVPMDKKEKWNWKSPLTVMKLRRCNSFFRSGALEPLDYFVHLEYLEINRCDVLVHWPEKVFQSLVALRRLVVENCDNLTGYAQAPLEPSSSIRSQHVPGLESLQLQDCASLVEMFNVPASLKSMTIDGCNKLESIFGKQQQDTSELVQGSSCSEEILPTAVSELSPSPLDHFHPCLENLYLYGCVSLSGVLHLPPSLKTILIFYCSNIQVLSCQLDGVQKPHVTTYGSHPAAATASEHSLPSCLESLEISSCSSILGGILCLPTTLKKLEILHNPGLTSLEFLSGEPPSLESLCLSSCSTLASLPNEPQAYMSLRQLIIKDCPAIKKLPRSLQQQLGSIKHKELDARYQVRQWRKANRN